MVAYVVRTLWGMRAQVDLGPVLALRECCEPLTAQVPDEADSARLATAFRALGDPVRLRLLSLLLTARGGQVCACDLVDPLHRSQPTVSHHLKVLRDAGLVTARRSGTNIWYSVEHQQLDTLRHVLQVPSGEQPDAAVDGAR
jgi:ArsR family transcriptional regulator